MTTDDIDRNNDRERRVLEQLDAMGDKIAWEAIVRHMATSLAKENPKLLVEIIVRRGLKIAEARAKAGALGVDTAEVVAIEFDCVGVGVVVV